MNQLFSWTYKFRFWWIKFAYQLRMSSIFDSLEQEGSGWLASAALKIPKTQILKFRKIKDSSVNETLGWWILNTVNSEIKTNSHYVIHLPLKISNLRLKKGLEFRNGKISFKFIEVLCMQECSNELSQV